MKKLLVLTDFMEASIDAMTYAAAFARAAGAEIILYHSYDVGEEISEELEEATKKMKHEKSLERLQSFASAMNLKEDLKIECISQFAAEGEDLNKIAREKDVDLIVMGINRASWIERVILGTSVTDVIGKVRVPVLIVPEKYHFKKPEKFLFAFSPDHQSLPETRDFKEFLSTQKAVLHATCFMKELLDETTGKAIAEKIKNHFGELLHDLTFKLVEDWKTQIPEFLSVNSIDVVCLCRREQLAGKLQLNNLILDPIVPVLSLPVQKK